MNDFGPAARFTGDDPVAALPQALPDRRELALICVERTRMPMIVTDARQAGNPIVLANQAFLDLTGYSGAELLGLNPRFMQGPDTDPADVARIRDALAAGREITTELLNYRKDGSSFWNQLLVSPIYDDAGTLLYYFGSSLDVTRQRDAQELERGEHRLLKEIDHRAKNALAIVQGIVRLSRRDNPSGYASAVQGRVEVLARAHGMLAEGGWRDVPLARLISHEAATFGRGRIHHQGADILLPAGKVQPFALLLHELAMNAAEHGALSAGGEVGIDWALEEDGRQLAIRWCEQGGPTPREDRVAGFGLTMSRSIAERQLGRPLKLDFAPDGLRAVIGVTLDARG